jgi:hypothetical protein
MVRAESSDWPGCGDAASFSVKDIVTGAIRMI